MATHSSILAWRIPWTEEPGTPQSLGSQGVGKDWSNWVRTNTPYVLGYCSRVKGNSDCSSSEAFQTNEERIWLNFIKIMKTELASLSMLHTSSGARHHLYSVQCPLGLCSVVSLEVTHICVANSRIWELWGNHWSWKNVNVREIF